MREINEKRTEQRLVYRWPVRFKLQNDATAISAQIFDLSSNSIAFICSSNLNCPLMFQKINISFAVPAFNQSNSFDTVLVERKGLVLRVDKLSNKISRIIVRFTEPLLFKPGQQDISDAELHKRLEDKALSVLKAEENSRVYQQALDKAEEKIRIYAQAKAQVEEKLRVEIEKRCKAEITLKQVSDKKLVYYMEIAAKANERAEAEKRLRLEAEKKVEIYAAKLDKNKALNSVQETEDTKNNKENMPSDPKTEADIPIKEIVLKKVDKFITEKNTFW